MSSIQGQVLRLSERREVAIYLREDTLWIADFIDGDGALVDAATWFRFNCGALSTYHARRRMVRESAIPLSPALVSRIENLHRGITATKGDRAMPPPDGDTRSPRARSAIAQFFRRLFARRPRHPAAPATRRGLRTGALPGAAQMHSRCEPHEIEPHSYEENG